MSRLDFITQEATEDIISRVSDVCLECYSDIKVGDTIHYDVSNCRYLCKNCQERLSEQQKEKIEYEEEISGRLF